MQPFTEPLDGAVYAYAMQQFGYTATPDQVLVRFDVLVKTKGPQFEQLYFNKGEHGWWGCG
jgi:hypothetical protein